MNIDLNSIFSSFNHQPTVVDDMIAQACNTEHKKDPDIALELEIIDVIKQRKTGPREAAYALLRHINSRNFREAMLALHLLDLCVKNCDYAFHLQIGSKEFLNALVKRFPDRPAAQRNVVIDKILELLQMWDQTICHTSKHKEDLKNVSEMVRLLGFKGYMFPDVRKEDLAAFVPHDLGFKTKEEMEKEDMAEMGIKLQELLRRATPRDLEEANNLMKRMAGYEQRVDYNKKLKEELDRIESSAKALDGLLNSVKGGDDLGSDRALQEALSKCKTAKPKLEQMLSEEDDDKIVNRVLILNDLINGVLQKYESVKTQLKSMPNTAKGNDIPVVGLNAPSKKEVSLIDLDDFNEPPKSSAISGGLGELGFASTVQQPNIGAPKASDDLLDIFGINEAPAKPVTIPILPTATAAPYTEKPLYDSRGLKIFTLIDVKNYAMDGICSILFKIINETDNAFANFTFQIAVPKGVDMKLEPLSASLVPPRNKTNPVTQVMHIRNNVKAALKIRFRIAYFVNGQPISDQSESPVLL